MDGVRRKQVLVGQQIILNDHLAGNTERREQNSAEYTGSVFPGRTVFDGGQITGSESLQDFRVLSGILRRVLVSANGIVRLTVDGRNSAFKVLGSRAGDQIRADGHSQKLRCDSNPMIGRPRTLAVRADIAD